MSELKPRQKEACELYVANPEMNVADIAEQVGVDKRTMYRWFKKPEWREYEHALCQERFRSIEKLAVLKLAQNVAGNQQRAIEYCLDYLGYNATQKLEAEVKNQVTFEGEANLED